MRTHFMRAALRLLVASATLCAASLGSVQYAHADVDGRVGNRARPQLAVQEATEDVDRGAAGIRADLERIVSSEEGSGWFLDRTHYTAIYPVVLQSVCAATAPARQRAERQLAEESRDLGSAESLYEEDGKKSSRVQLALHVEHMHGALERAIAGADHDCPFWTEPIVGYDGRQTDRNRFTLSLETGGLAQLRRSAGAWGYGGGAGLRILPGYGFGKVTVLGGLELAGGAIATVGETTSVVVNYLPALPLVLRLRSTSWHVDFEVAALGLFQSNNADWSYGARAGVGLGVSGLRTRFFIPWVGVAAAYDYFAESAARPSAHFFRGGLRLGFQWDP
jgi:hypothetical protein